MRDCGREAIALCMVAAVLGGCGRGTPAPPARPTPDVTTVVAAPRDIPVTFEFVAQTQSSQAVNIQARVSGFLDKRVYTEGDVVRAGQVLFQMDPKPFQAQVDAAQAQLNNSRRRWRSRSPTSTAPSRWQSKTRCRKRTSTMPTGSTDVEGERGAGARQARDARSSTCRTRRSPRRSPASPAARSSPTARTSARRTPADDGLGAVADVDQLQPVGERGAAQPG